MSEESEDADEGINGKVINNLRYAHDTALIAAGSIEEFQKIVNRVVASSKTWVYV